MVFFGKKHIDIEEITTICASKGLRVLEDQSIGTEHSMHKGWMLSVDDDVDLVRRVLKQLVDIMMQESTLINSNIYNLRHGGTPDSVKYDFVRNSVVVVPCEI